MSDIRFRSFLVILCCFSFLFFGFNQSLSASEPITNSLGMTFVYIEPGTFMMGSPPDEPGHYSEETQHQVTLTQGYFMQTTEVTVGQWRAFIRDTGYKTEAETDGGAWVWTGSQFEKKAGTYWANPGFSQADSHPVTCVSWNDVQKYIAWLNRKDTGTYRLPTEAEWEYAARAGSTTAYHFGNSESDLSRYAWYSANSNRRTHPVGQKLPNAWGLYDVHGNVWEWVADWFGTYPTLAVTDPTGPSSGADRVLRGGSWGSYARGCRSALRDWLNPGSRNNAIGFRLARHPGQ